MKKILLLIGSITIYSLNASSAHAVTSEIYRQRVNRIFKDTISDSLIIDYEVYDESETSNNTKKGLCNIRFNIPKSSSQEKRTSDALKKDPKPFPKPPCA